MVVVNENSFYSKGCFQVMLTGEGEAFISIVLSCHVEIL